MQLSYHFTTVRPAEINLTEKKFLFSFPERSPFLIDSIRNFGLIEPPILLEEETGFTVVCGEGRIRACLKLSVDEIPVLVIRKRPEEKTLLLLSLESNLFRGLNLVERALFMERAERFFSDEELPKLLPKLGFSESRRWIFYFRKLLNLEERLLTLFAMEKLNPKLVESLSELTETERAEFLEILEKIHLSHSEQREVLEILLDYRRRTGGSEFIPVELRETLLIEDRNERRRAFFDAIKRLKYPYSFPFLMKLRWISDHFKSSGIEVSFAPYLEKREVTLRFAVDSEEELERRLRFLKERSSLLFSVFGEESGEERSSY